MRINLKNCPLVCYSKIKCKNIESQLATYKNSVMIICSVQYCSIDLLKSIVSILYKRYQEFFHIDNFSFYENVESCHI